MNVNRRNFLTSAAAAAGGAALGRMVPIAQAAQVGTNVVSKGVTAPFVPPADWKGYKAVITPNGLTLPWKMVDGVKVFHLIAEPVTHEFAPGLDTLTDDSPAPLQPGPDGKYPIPEPGRKKDREY